MAREIKFRGWNRKLGKFIPNYEPFFVNIHDLTYIQGGAPEWQRDYDVIFQQFTGILDKNDKEIYEGDVIKYPLIGNPFQQTVFNIKTIEWNSENGSWNFPSIVFGCPDFKQIEVIGNIFENPELIK